ncbi:branched-chain amino acid ABC transporter permease [Variovorax sp. VNK109]|uniref:branched-chain amino acid ABC transporter permease n=1 Tax=Variovorax sp. VNK109 TaxID=3400919 RepID=UPI003C051E13
MVAFFSQLLLGLINGSFYALLSLGLAVIFGMLNSVNFAHGAMYMVGAFLAWMCLVQLPELVGPDIQIGYWWALLVVPLVVAVLGMGFERGFLRKLRKLDPIYGMLFTFGLALVLEGLFKNFYGAAGRPYPIPDALRGAVDIGFMMLPKYRVWVVIASLSVCFLVWYFIEKTRMGAYLRAGTENAATAQALGINVPLLVCLTYGLGVGLAAFCGVLAAPIFQVSPRMGSELIIVVFAVVVIGGMGSIAGAIITGLALGVIEGIVKMIYPESSAIVVFVIMSVVLALRPAGLFGRN